MNITRHKIKPMKTSQQNTDELLERIANHLIINSSIIKDIGLYHGKMGIVIFFFHYSRYTNNSIYEEFAGKLLDEIFEEIHDEIPINFESGLCGIAWAIEYLIENKFVEGNPDEILFDIDQKIMERDILRIKDKTIKTGLEGISYYINKAVNSKSRKKKNLFDKNYLDAWERVNSKSVLSDDKQLLAKITDTVPSDNIIYNWKLGLESGCAGYGRKHIIQ